MLAIMIVLRPRRSISRPPSRPNTPPHSAAIHSIRPPQARTCTLVGGAPRFSPSVGLNPSSAAHPVGLPSALTWISSPTASEPITGNINSSYVSNRKPIEAIVSTMMRVVDPRRAVADGAAEDTGIGSEQDAGINGQGVL